MTLAVLLAGATLGTLGCIIVVVETPLYRSEWGAKPAGAEDECPDLAGTFANEGQSGGSCSWIAPLPFPFWCSRDPEWTGVPRFDAEMGAPRGENATHFSIAQSDSERLHITVFSRANTLVHREFRRAEGEFACGKGRVTLVELLSDIVDRTHEVRRQLGRSPDGSLLVRRVEFLRYSGAGSPIALVSHSTEWQRYPAAASAVEDDGARDRDGA